MKKAVNLNFILLSIFSRLEENNCQQPQQISSSEQDGHGQSSNNFVATPNQTTAGRHVPTIDGDQVFIPKLNLDDQWSIEDHVKSIDMVKVSDKSCQVSDKSCQVSNKSYQNSDKSCQLEEEETPKVLPKPTRKKTKRKTKVNL